MDIGQTFDIVIDGIKKQAKILDVISFQNERYAIYTVNSINNRCDIHTSKIIRTDDGHDELTGYASKEIKEYILNLINDNIK